MNKLLLAVLLFLLGQTIIWFQTNGQFLWKWFEKHPIILSITLGSIISYCFIHATKYAYLYFDGLLWPGRLVGFGSGMIVMAILTWCILGEGISTKTLVSLGLATTLVFIQVFWK